MWNWNKTASEYKHEEAKNRRINFFSSSLLRVLFFVAVCTSLLPKTTLANAAPPIPKLWLTFADVNGQPINPTAVQVLGCMDETCAVPELLAAAGMCSSAPCFTSQLKTVLPFECRSQHCLVGITSRFPQQFKLVAQVNNRVAQSQVIKTETLNIDYNTPSSVRVTAGNGGDGLTVTAAAQKPNFGLPQNFGPAFLLTLITEVLIGLVFLLAFKKPPLPLLLLIGLMQALSFPVVWFFFPSLQAWQMPNNRFLGLLLLGVAVLFGGLLVWMRRATKRNTRVLSIVALVVAVPITVVCLFFGLIIAGYGFSQFPTAAGLPYPFMLVGAEAFAVIYEATLIFLLSNRSLSLKQSGLMSLTANTMSFGLGLLLFPINPVFPAL